VPWPPKGWPPQRWPSTGETAKALDELADRVAYNREVAGVHYNMDTQCGHWAALHCLFQLRNPASATPLFKALVVNAQTELQDLP
jgi:hypothetical protein